MNNLNEINENLIESNDNLEVLLFPDTMISEDIFITSDDELYNFELQNNQRGVSEELINCFSKCKITDKNKVEQDKCVICLEQFKVGDEVLRIPCIHLFHSKCICKWFKNHNNCPICKFEVKEENNY